LGMNVTTLQYISLCLLPRSSQTWHFLGQMLIFGSFHVRSPIV
jgi:hypothetical protein